MIIKETPIFTRLIQEFISDDEYRQLQESLINNSAKGDVIPASGGLRKLRWKTSSQGKRGGIRVIYYCLHKDELYMIYTYKKNNMSDLTKEQLNQLKHVVDKELKNE